MGTEAQRVLGPVPGRYNHAARNGSGPVCKNSLALPHLMSAAQPDSR